MTLEMLVYAAFFYVFAFCAILLAICAVVTKRILRSAVYLMGVLLISAAFYVMLNAQFLAGVQVLVYVGGIVVLLVYAVMLTQTSQVLETLPSRIRNTLGFFVGVGFFCFSLWCIFNSDLTLITINSKNINLATQDIRAIGKKLLSTERGGYAVAFEVLSILLLVSVLGGIVLARKISPGETSPKETHVG
ncbi:MAG: NADH-quinone oxidoreductase subunit J [Deltaproteobacteria bacterium]|nr:NADH-quinone oxidoreductase subunit J [Deltaproteobacteria bacterium]